MTGTASDGTGDPDERLFRTTARGGVLRVARAGTRWLSTGWRGGEIDADAAYSVSVPEGWNPPDVGEYVRRRVAAGFADDEAGAAAAGDRPVLITGVDASHARGARLGPVEAYATAGLSNPAALPVPGGDGFPGGGGPGDPGDRRRPGGFPDGSGESDGSAGSGEDDGADGAGEGHRSRGRNGAGDPDAEGDGDGHPQPGTVNVVVGTRRALPRGALANLVAVAAEAKAATLLATAGVPGTTTDAVVAACDPGGERARYSGTATPVGRAARVCVRDAVLTSLRSRYPGGDYPAPGTADHGVTTEGRATVFDVVPD